MPQTKLIKKLKALNYPDKTAIAIATERIYQEKVWNDKTTESGGIHNNTEFLVFVRSYLNKAIDVVSSRPEPEASKEASEILRKIGAMVIASAEINEWTDILYQELENLSTEVFKDFNVVEFLAIINDKANEAFSIMPYSKINESYYEKGIKKMAEILFLSLEAMKYNYSIPR